MMSEARKSALISAFIYPGGGHLYLKRKIVGGVLAIIASWALFILIGHIITRTIEISNKIISGQLTPDLATIRQLIFQPQQATAHENLSIATTVLIIVWIVGIIDSYRLGRAKDILDQKNGKTQEG